MKNSALKLISGSLMVLGFFCSASAQQGTIQMSDGVTVSIKTVTTPKNDTGNSYGNIYSSQSDGTVHRVMTDRKNKIYFGYDLVVARQDDTGKFEVSIRPLSKAPDALTGRVSVGSGSNETAETGVSSGTGRSTGTGVSAGSEVTGGSNYRDYSPQSLQSYPDPVIIEDGDSISIDLLENPATNMKITDVIKIIYKASQFGAIYSKDSSARDFTIDEVLLRIETPDVFINEEKHKTRSSVAGNVIWINFPGKGRFIFSFLPQPAFAFKKTGVIEDNKILFEFNGDVYKLLSRSTILAYGGKWNLWVMHDPGYSSDPALSGGSDFQFGGASSVDLLFRSQAVMMQQ